MEEELTVNEACRMHVLADEDYARSCNADGSVKAQQRTTHISIGSGRSISFTVDNTVLLATYAGIGLGILILVIFLIVRRKNKKRR